MFCQWLLWGVIRIGMLMMLYMMMMMMMLEVVGAVALVEKIAIMIHTQTWFGFSMKTIDGLAFGNA